MLALILLWLGLYPNLTVPKLAWSLLLVAVAANGLIYRTKLLSWRFAVRLVRTKLTNFKGRWFVLVFLVILAIQMSPLVGLWVTPGDDAKLYSLISLRIVESQGVPRNWGIFANPSWYTEYTHLLLPGFSSEVVFLNFLIGGSIPGTVSVLASLFRSLTAATLYVLVWTLTRRKMPSVLAMGVYGLMIVEPTFGWFTWGGMAELAAVSLLPVAAAGTYLLSTGPKISWRLITWTAVLVSGMSLLHPFSFFYYLTFLVALTFASLFNRRISRGLSVCLPAILGLVIGSGPILNSLTQELAVSQSYSIVNPAWTPVLSLSMAFPVALYSLLSRFVIVYGFATFIILVLEIGGLVFVKEFFRFEKGLLVILSGWYLLMFLLHENNPNGLFVVPFPLWYRIDSNRTFGITSLIVTVVVGLLGERWIRRFLRGWPAYSARSIPKLHKLMKIDRRRFLISGTLLILVISQMALNTSLLFGARSNSPVGFDDITAFDWIRTQTPVNSTFFVNSADAGSWIPIYAERKVVMPFGVVTNNTLLENYAALVSSFARDPSSSQVLQFMKSLGVSYVYSGPSRIYGRVGFDPTSIIKTRLFTVEFNIGDVWVFHLE